jgi:hypothetical protein
MDLAAKKREIIDAINKSNDEKLIGAIVRLLHLDDDMDIPEWHKQIVEERIEKYEAGEGKMKNWEEVQKNL